MDITRTKPRRRLSRGLRLLIGIVVGLALVIGGVVVTGHLRQALRTSGLQDTVDQAYAVARPEAERRRSTGDAVLTDLLGPVLLRSSAVTCTLDHSDAGLMVQSWSQQCMIRTVDVYPTTLSYADLDARAESAARTANLEDSVLGAAVAGAVPRTGCGPVRSTGDRWATGPQVTVTRLQAGAFHPTDPDRDLATDCQVPVPVYDVPTTRVDASFVREAVTADRSWVVVERRTEFLTTDLGCVGILFCSAPISSARLPRA